MATSDTSVTVVIEDSETFREKEVEKQLMSCTVLAVDTEFISEDLTLSLIQISTPAKKVFLFNILKCPGITKLLKTVLQSPDITKVMHACKNDSKVLWQRKNRWIKLNKVFDTQLIDQIMRSMKYKRPIHDKPAGLEAVCKDNGVTIDSDLKHQVKAELNRNKAYFRTRNSDDSIPDSMRDYAVQDVTVLIDLHNKMNSLLGDDMKPLYNRLIDVALYADLDGVDNRWSYDRDKQLLRRTAYPQLLANFDAGH